MLNKLNIITQFCKIQQTRRFTPTATSKLHM